MLSFLFHCSCLNQCTYCKTKHARGELGSYQPEDIVARAVQSFQGNFSIDQIRSDHLFQPNSQTPINQKCLLSYFFCFTLLYL